MLLINSTTRPRSIANMHGRGLDLDRTFQELWQIMFHALPAEHKPPMVIDLYGEVEPDNTDELVNGGVSIQLAVAGFQAEDLLVYAKDNILYIEGDNRQRSNVPEKFKSKFMKQLPAKKNIDLSKADVDLKYGILTIKIPFICPEENRTYLFGNKRTEEANKDEDKEKR